MNKLLISYIKQYLKEATIPYEAENIDAQLQHKLSPNVIKDMTHIEDPKEILKLLMKNLGDRTCISFVNSHDDKGNIPHFSINPHAQYETPHGNYAYPLTLENLRELTNIRKVHGANFAIDRPYFLLFKINSPNTLIINKNGTSNYNEIMSNKSSSLVNNINHDADRVLRSFAYFILSGVKKKAKETIGIDITDDFDKKDFDRDFSALKLQIKTQFTFLESDKHGISIDEFMYNIFEKIDYFIEDSIIEFKNISKEAENEFINYFRTDFKNSLLKVSETFHNKFFKKDRKTDDFHKIYFICWTLSKIADKIAFGKGSGPLLTMFLKEVGIDGIIDHGSATLHHAEPEQAVSLNFGNKEGKHIDFIGTFNNIFKSEVADAISLPEIAAEVYQEEGYKFDIDYYSPDSETYGVFKDISNQSNKEGSEVIAKTLKYVSHILGMLDDKKIIRFLEDAMYSDIDSAMFEININTNISNSEMQFLLKTIKEINQIADSLSDHFSFDLEVIKKFVQFEDSHVSVDKLLTDLYLNQDFIKNFPYEDPSYHPLVMNNMKNGNFLFDSDFVKKVVVDSIILNYCEKEFVVQVEKPQILGHLLYDNILNINGGNPTIDVSKISNDIKLKNDQQEIKMFEEMCNDLKDKFINITLEK